MQITYFSWHFLCLTYSALLFALLTGLDDR